MRILVTGGAGFIGSHVVDAYRKAGHTAAVLDNLSSGKKENLPAGISLYKGDITDENFVTTVFKDFKPEVINHHAAQVSVVASVRDSIFDAKNNIIGTKVLLTAVIKHVPHAKFIYASSGGAMYGKHEEIPYVETSTPAANSPYGLSKYVAEQYVWLYTKLHGIRATVLRYSNVYGPRQDAHGEAGVCAIFADKMLLQQPVTIFGEGTAVRDYVYVGDVAQANVLALMAGDGESYNISTGKEITTQRVFTEMKHALRYQLDPILAPLRPGEVTRSVLNPQKAREHLQWEAKYQFADGIAETAAWYKQRV